MIDEIKEYLASLLEVVFQLIGLGIGIGVAFTIALFIVLLGVTLVTKMLGVTL